MAVALAAALAGCSLAVDFDRNLIPAGDADGTLRGSLDGFSNGHVSGWACIVGRDTPVDVRIEVDGTAATTVIANEMREDLVSKGLHPTGLAGFSAELGPLSSGSVIQAFVVDGELSGSPLTLP